MFVVEAQTDSVQLGAHDWVPTDHLNDTEVQAYLSEWKANQTVGLQATLKPIDGWFNPACFIHTGFHHGASYLEHIDFLAAIRNGTPALVTAEAGLRSVAIGVAAHQSIEEGRVVDLRAEGLLS